MTEKYHFNEQAADPFDFMNFKKALIKQYGAIQGEFLSKAINEQYGDFLEQSSRFFKLVQWCENEIKQAGAIINVFTPADKTDFYTTADFKTFREQVQTVGELVYYHALLLDSRTTTAQRENIEHTICKVYGVKYNEYLGVYL